MKMTQPSTPLITFRRAPLAAAALGLACALAACGGGGGDDGAASAGAAPASPAPGQGPGPGPGPASSDVQSAFGSEGVYHLWGFNFVVDNVTQTFVSRQTVGAQGLFAVQKVAGAVASIETPPTVLDAVDERYFAGGTSAGSCTRTLSFASAAQAVLGCVEANLAPVKWSVRLNPVDVGGRRVGEYLRRADGAPVDLTRLPAPDTQFPGGAVAYFPSFEAQSDMIVMNRGEGVAGSPVGAGWCQEVPGQNYQLGVRLNADHTVSLFDIPLAEGCVLSGALRGAPAATGSWQQGITAGVPSYQLSVPEAFKAQARWAPLFATAPVPRTRASLLLLDLGGGQWLHATAIAKGDRFSGLQPHFNAAALPALKQAAGLK